ncbi:MAG: hypothetical protein IT382_08305 [Deltaproteobacteria bacterium]|nr:hypothetical protein [Deltaproteobacteria bacterium]
MSCAAQALLFAAFASLPAKGASTEPQTAALLPLMAPDLLEPQKRAIEERIRALAAQHGVALQPAAETRKGIEQAKKAGAACSLESLACQAQIGVLVGASLVIVARVASDWAGDRLELRLLDALRGAAVREAAHLLPKEAELRERIVDGVILSVLAPQQTGSLDLKAGAGAITLDGVALDPAAARGRIEGLAPGPHQLELRVEGQAPAQQTVVIQSGQTATLALGMVKDEAPPPPPPAPEGPTLAPWLVAGGALLAAAAGATAGGLQAALEYSAMERGTRDAVRVTGIGLLGATAVGAVVAGVGGVMLATGGAP